MTFPKQLQRAIAQACRFKLLWVGLLAVGTVVLLGAVNQLGASDVYRSLDELAFWLGDTYDRWFQQQATTNPLTLIGLSFVGGLFASVSPCILSLLPVNLSYIGTRDIASRKDAFYKAGAFVLGVVTVLSLLGLFSSLAAIVLVRFRGYFHVAVGTLILLMGLSLAEFIRLPRLPAIASSNVSLPTSKTEPRSLRSLAILQTTVQKVLTGPYGVGLTFALISSPCTSPVMFTVLAAAAATGSQLQSAVAMTSYALGYTAIIFLASLFAGIAKQASGLLIHSHHITRIASIGLLLVGSFYLVTGLQWLWLTGLR